MDYYLLIEKLARLVRDKRGNRGLRDAASEIENVSPSTLSRVENGKIPDLNTFLTLCSWLEIPPTKFIGGDKKGSELNTPEAILVQLRADKRLDSSIVDVLSSLIKVAYRDFARKDEAKSHDLQSQSNSGSQQYSLQDLLADASSEDFAGEYDWGRPMGREVW